MPEYLYIDANGHETTVTHRMLYSSSVICSTCEELMWRKPQPVTVIWGGLPPSAGDLDPNIQDLLDTRDERRDDFAEMHEKHERQTEAE